MIAAAGTELQRDSTAEQFAGAGGRTHRHHQIGHRRSSELGSPAAGCRGSRRRRTAQDEGRRDIVRPQPPGDPLGAGLCWIKGIQPGSEQGADQVGARAVGDVLRD